MHSGKYGIITVARIVRYVIYITHFFLHKEFFPQSSVKELKREKFFTIEV